VPLDVLTHCICIQILVSANTLENICENMLTHVHNMIHLVVSIFDKGGEVGEVKELSRGGRTLPLE
jgi:hypothetical protein